jgi:GntR family transcriptional regulator
MPAVPMSSAQIVEDLTARIAAGEYPPGTKLPSYAELGRLYNITHSTAARVILILRERGIVVGVPGRGVYVSETGESSFSTGIE